MLYALADQLPLISIHALAKRATDADDAELRRYIISIHALAKRATREIYKSWQKFFISIHALAKRATKFLKITSYLKAISIHALAKRATLNLLSIPGVTDDFNPRPRKEGDKGQNMYISYAYISINSHAKRATTI